MAEAEGSGAEDVNDSGQYIILKHFKEFQKLYNPLA